AFGAATFRTTSHAHGSPIVAPASVYAASGNPASIPAPSSTTTSTPSPRRPTVSGTSAARRSPGADSFGTPTRIRATLPQRSAVYGGDAPGDAPPSRLRARPALPADRDRVGGHSTSRRDRARRGSSARARPLGHRVGDRRCRRRRDRRRQRRLLARPRRRP